MGGTGVVSLGTVTQAGPAAVTVNTTSFQVTANTKVTINAVPAQVTDLQPGMVVEVEAYKYPNTHVTEAEKISYKNILTGPISTISANCGSMIILGQTIEADSHTLPTLMRGLCDFSVGQLVEISGFVSNPVTNSVLATFIRLKGPSHNISVSGNIASVLPPQKSFTIGALTIDYSGAVLKPSGATPVVGKFAQVEGIATGPDTVTASEVEISSTGYVGVEGTEAEVSGFISNLSGFNFSVNGQAVNASAATISPATASLADGAKVEVHGTFNGVGVIKATEIEIKPSSPINIESTVEATSASGLTLLGTPILVTGATTFVDQSGLASALKLSDINLNDQITVSCYRNAAGNLVASKVVLRNPSGKFVVEGEVVSVQPGLNKFSMIQDVNIIVLIDSNHTEIKSDAGPSVSATEFLAQLHIGSRVKAEGVRGIGKTLDATSGKVELKDH